LKKSQTPVSSTRTGRKWDERQKNAGGRDEARGEKEIFYISDQESYIHGFIVFLFFVLRPRIESSGELGFQDMYSHAETDMRRWGKEGERVRVGRKETENLEKRKKAAK